MNSGNELTDKYRDRFRGTVLTQILKLMRQHGITTQEIESYDRDHVTDETERLLRIRKKTAMKVTDNGTRRKQV